ILLRAETARQRLQNRAQFRIADIAQAVAQLHGYGLERRRCRSRALSIWRLNRALPQLDAGDGLVAEEPVHALDDLGDHVLDQRRMCRQHHELENAFALLPGRETNCLRQADLRVTLTDDLGPTRHHARLHEAEPPEGGAADLRHQFGNRLRRTASRSLVGPRFPRRFPATLAFHTAMPHAIAAPWWIGS